MFPLALVEGRGDVEIEDGGTRVVVRPDGVNAGAVAVETEMVIVWLRVLTGSGVSAGELTEAGMGTSEVSEGTGELKEPVIPESLLQHR